MIPYFKFTTIPLGPLQIQVWGLLVSLGILAGAWVATKMAEHRKQDPAVVWDVTFWIIIASFIGARIVHLLYEPAYYLSHPLAILQVWHGGFSIMGGFVGAVIAAVVFLRKRKLDLLAYCDTLIFGLPVGLFIGRIGCFLIHDHPGTLTHFVLGVNYPGGVRHDHGLYLSLEGLVLFLLFLFLAHKRVKIGTYLVVFLILDGTIRFFLDFLRATDGPIIDVRYAGLTPAQYFAIIMVIAGIVLYKKSKNARIN